MKRLPQVRGTAEEEAADTSMVAACISLTGLHQEGPIIIPRWKGGKKRGEAGSKQGQYGDESGAGEASKVRRCVNNWKQGEIEAEVLVVQDRHFGTTLRKMRSRLTLDSSARLIVRGEDADGVGPGGKDGGPIHSRRQLLVLFGE